MVRSRIRPAHTGNQERGLRAGTVNVPGIAGFGRAAGIAFDTMRERAEKTGALRDYLIGRVLEEIPLAKLNGHPQQRLPGNANFSFPFAEGTSMLIMLDAEGICASSGSACTAGSGEPSHVLQAIGLSQEYAHGSLRLTLSEENTREEIDRTVDCLKKILSHLRSISDDYEKALQAGAL